MRDFNNDTIALTFLGLTALFALFMGSDSGVNVALGAIGGYIGSKTIGGE